MQDIFFKKETRKSMVQEISNFQRANYMQKYISLISRKVIMYERMNKTIKLLEQVTIPYHLEKCLEQKYFPVEDSDKEVLQLKISKYKQKINHFFETTDIKNIIKRYISNNKKNDPYEIIKPVEYKTDIKKIAYKAAIYFQQGLEMLKTAIIMHENVSPLVEYYGFLQCVKGSIILELDIYKDLFFSYHGLTQVKNDEICSKKLKEKNSLTTHSKIQLSKYINAEIKTLGVFSALLLRITDFYEKENKKEYTMDKYLQKDYKPSIEEIVSIYHFDPPSVFIGSWMLSTLVRYKPAKWQEICSGIKDDIITRIRKFRREKIPATIESLLNDYVTQIIDW